MKTTLAFFALALRPPLAAHSSNIPAAFIVACLRLYGAGRRIIEKQWVAGDLVEVKGGT